jgi:polar amino acid transport system substrate-binding protein
MMTIMMNSLLWLVLPLLSFYAVAESKPKLIFCYQDSPLPPYYLGSGAQTPSQPGASIEHLRRLTKKAGLQLELLRRPWGRCLAELKTNKIHAVIGRYTPERGSFSRFPEKDGQPDPSRAFAEHASCLVARKTRDWSWDGKQIISSHNLVLARPNGFVPLNVSASAAVVQQVMMDGTLDMAMLQQKRIDAATTLCRVAGFSINTQMMDQFQLEVLWPPVTVSTSYLIFSRGFYKQNQKVADQVWRELQQDKRLDIYQRLLKQ